MSHNYTESDVISVAEGLISPERAHGRISFFDDPDSLLSVMKGRISDVLTSDPDSLFWFMSLVSSRCITLANSVLAETASIRSNLLVSSAPSSYIDSEGLQNVIAGFSDLKTGALGERKRKLRKLKALAVKVIASYSKAGSTGVEKDAETARVDILNSLATLTSSINELQSLVLLFTSAPDTYFESGLFLSSVDTQTDLVTEALSPYMESDGIDSADALIVIASGIGLIDSVADVPNPGDPKYAGPVVVVDGIAARATGTKSLPFKTAGGTVAITSDGEAGLLTVPASTVPTITSYPQIEKDSGAGAHWITVYPIAATSQLKLLVDNTTYTLSVGTNINTSAELRTKLDAAAIVAGAPVTVSGTGDDVIFTYTGARLGSSSRISLYNDDGVGGGTDLNILCELNYTTYLESRGEDTRASGLSLGGYTVSEPTLMFDTTTVLRDYTTLTPPTLVLGNTVIPLETGHGAAVDDSVFLGGSIYTIGAVDATSVTLTEEALGAFDGTTLTPVTSGVETITIVRDYVVVTSPSTVWGTTSLLCASNILGLPTTLLEGVHNTVQLSSALLEGSPIRVGDAVINLEDLSDTIGHVSAVQSGGVVLDLVGSTLTTDKLHIESLGLNTYRSIEPYLQHISLLGEELPDISLLTRNVGVSALSGNSKVIAEAGVALLESYANSTITALTPYKAVTTRDAVAMLGTLKESGLGSMATLLAQCDFRALYSLTPEELSDLVGIQNLFNSVIDSMGESSNVSHIGPDVPDSEYEPAL